MDKSTFAALLPADAPGALPYWMLFVSTSSRPRSPSECTAALPLRARLADPLGLSSADSSASSRFVLNPLQARTFAVWTLMSAAVRIYASYNISNKVIYDLALVSYALAWLHFVSEALVFRTAGLAGVISPFIVSCESVVAPRAFSTKLRASQYDFYIRV
ncbi:SPOSA6832_04058 [Sporobolomyces salmonicolor]|uniref:SPOSA6832_04058-mRNA-1:cds n=1 Tax=Sporidiobolus salmonicolor TaxID=5005 RepID=A0A0D6EQF1_SPOSA|nr:SPOSA6832_04058 [Sporobolomyces salmonicolor]